MTQLEDLARRRGIVPGFQDIHGKTHRASPDTLRRILAVLEDSDGPEAPPWQSDRTEARPSAPRGCRCFVPDWLDRGRLWGVAAQLYQVRSSRSWGIGDFEDLARLAELLAARGADFLGLNPLHALFVADSQRVSPFSPSNRCFLNPLYIAADLVPGFDAGDLDRDALTAARASPLIDYGTVARLKSHALSRSWQRWQTEAPRQGIYAGLAFERFRAQAGTALESHALFETLSAAMTAQGHDAGWLGWPADYQDPNGTTVAAFAAANCDDVRFHAWLQWLADVQLGEAQRRAREAGMRIGLYLDLAVGEDPGGSAAWADPGSLARGLRIGAPPDLFNPAGQNWGIAPLSPSALLRAENGPFERMMSGAMRHAGALRIDHAMGLFQLYLIPEDEDARQGAYVRMPMRHLLTTLSDRSRRHRVVVIGEDLGTVPDGFRSAMTRCQIHSYRVLYFERDRGRLRRPTTYPRVALACLSTHDLAPLAGWWTGRDIALRGQFGLGSDAEISSQRREREADCASLASRVRRAGLLPQGTSATELDTGTAAAIHAYLARAPSRLFAVRLEDLAAEREPVNVPGTVHEYPNWRRKLSLALDELGSSDRFMRITEMVAAERPKL